MKNTIRSVSLCGLLLTVTTATTIGNVANAATSFESLAAKVHAEADPMLRIEISGRLVDCSELTEAGANGAELQGGEYAQWIYNDFYVWRLIPTRMGTCVYLSKPESRGLNIDDATALLLAHNREFPVPPPEPPSANPEYPNPNDTLGTYPSNFFYVPEWEKHDQKNRSEDSNNCTECSEMLGDPAQGNEKLENKEERSLNIPGDTVSVVDNR